jgi:hypothetical protein
MALTAERSRVTAVVCSCERSRSALQSSSSRPRIEHRALCSYDPATEYRAHRWLELAPRIGEDIFLKLYTHGTQERHSEYLLEGGLELTRSFITTECRRVPVSICTSQLPGRCVRPSMQPSAGMAGSYPNRTARPSRNLK